ncbi:hypothetical protein HF086_012251 [Spodoptera exigua]|uniref:Uncharacterized protein n=1 Tax=Spodoptera exigua TaxID=7107 RepID=A0A922MEF3_SPOEX|nr:hypothetical protein HF086_012251 [Spodoptera exigua]
MQHFFGCYSRCPLLIPGMFEHEQVRLQPRLDRSRLLAPRRTPPFPHSLRSRQQHKSCLQHDQEGNTVCRQILKAICMYSRGDSQRVIFRHGNHMSGSGSTSRYP